MHPVDHVAETSEGVVFEAPPREYTRHEFLSTVWKTGNFLRTLGVHEDSLVAVTADPTPESLLAFFGASLLDARVRFGPRDDVDARVVVGPTADIGRFDLPPGGQYVGYGDRPSDPSWSYLERDMWSENPDFPDVAHPPDAPLLDTDTGTVSARDAMVAASDVAASIAADDVVALRASLSLPGTVVAGILAPLAADASILLPGGDATGTIAVAGATAPEPRTIDPESVGAAFE